MGIVARGTPCEGVYPLVRVAVDGRPLGTIGVPDDRWRTVTTLGRVERGRHKVSVAFLNDASRPPAEDRNLFVDKVLVARDPDASGVTFLTSPPAVAVAAHGKGTAGESTACAGTPSSPTRKAARYAGSLLEALGGDFTPRTGTVIACASMTPQPGMGHFRNFGSHVALACNGWVKTPVEVAAAGRYAVELVASGTPAGGVYPLVEVHLDGRRIGQVQLTGGGWRPYWLAVDLPQGRHELALAFVNDLNRNGEDRNVMLERVTFYRE